MKKLSALFIFAAIAGFLSFSAFAGTHDHFGFGYGMDFGGFNRFGGFGYGMDFGHSFGSFGYGMDFGHNFGGFGYGMDFGHNFGGFGHGMDFTVRDADYDLSRVIVPIPPTASASASSIIYDESGEIRIRPFDDEDLFVED